MLVKIKNVSKDFEINLNKKVSDKRIKGTVLSVFKKTYRKSAFDFFKEENNVTKCPFCGNDSKYNIDIKIEENVIYIEFSQNTRENFIDYACHSKQCKHGLNPNSTEYVSKAFNISAEDALKYIHNRNKSPFYKENFDNEDDYKIYQTRDENWYIKKYGEEDGKAKYEEKMKFFHLSTTKDYVLEHKGLEYYLDWKKRRSVGCESWWIEKYGEEGKKKYKEYQEKVKCTEERMVKTYGEDEGRRRWMQYIDTKRYIMSGDYYRDKYGEDEGNKIWNNIKKKYSFTKKQYIEKYGEDAWEKCVKSRCYRASFSQESKNAFFELIEEISKTHTIENIYLGENEYGLYDSETEKYFSYDFKANIDGIDYIIEYDTPFLHPSKKYMSIDEYNNWFNVFNLDQTPQEKENFDEYKKEFAKKCGYKVFTFYVNKERNNNINIKEFLDFLSC